MQLKAVHDDARGGWVLNGQKVWTTSAHFADWYWVGARTDPEARKHKGISLLPDPMDHPGSTIRPTWTIGDERTNEVFFDDVFVPDEYVVGEVDHGWTYICEALDLERFAMMPVGPLEKKVEALCEHVRSAQRDGRAAARRPGSARRGRAPGDRPRGVAHAAAPRDLRGAGDGVPTTESSQYKLFMNEFGQRVADAALDLMGAEGQLQARRGGRTDRNGRFERSYRYTVVDTIGGGASEIQKNIIARRGLGLPPSY